LLLIITEARTHTRRRLVDVIDIKPDDNIKPADDTAPAARRHKASQMMIIKAA
jgi:hypothetical protein